MIGVEMKDGEVAALVNSLKEVALEWHNSGQLRERIKNEFYRHVKQAQEARDKERLNL